MPINDNTYSVNWNKLLSWLTPTTLFKAKMFALLKSLVAPVSTLHGDFIGFRKQKNYELGITGQVCKLEKLLNDKYDKSLRRIYITDGIKSKRKYIFNDSEFVPQPIYTEAEAKPYFIYQDGEITTTTYHFIVNIPVVVRYNADELISILSVFKMPSKKFNIQTF